MLKFRFTKIIILVLSFSSYGLSQTCDEWFKDLNLKASDKKCLSTCNTAEVDMGTFTCHNECEKFCKPKKEKKCTVDTSKIKPGKIPNKWPWTRDKTTILTIEELESLNQALARINPALLEKLGGIYLLDRPKDLFSAGTESLYYEGQIIIYKKLFENKEELINKITHELGHHLHETSESSSFSEYNKNHFIKNRKYLTADSKFSAEEDFAANFELYINNPSQLKKELPSVFNWFKKIRQKI